MTAEHDPWPTWRPSAARVPVVSVEVKRHLAKRAGKHVGAKVSGGFAAMHHADTFSPLARDRVLSLALEAMDTAPTGEDWTRLWALFVRIQQGGTAYLTECECHAAGECAWCRRPPRLGGSGHG